MTTTAGHRTLAAMVNRSEPRPAGRERTPLVSVRPLDGPTGGRRPQLHLAPDADRSAYERWGKRVLDLVVTSAALILLLPVMALTWSALRLALGPGILMRQRRVGLDGRDFAMFKFRTMRPTRRRFVADFDGEDRRRTHKSEYDPRHTSVGRWVRRLSLDEIPQLLNVLLGDMSLVGPRPELAEVADRHHLRSHPRHRVLPGLTGPWQVTHRGRGVLLHESMDTDLPYLEQVSLARDLALMARTAVVLLRPDGR